MKTLLAGAVGALALAGVALVATTPAEAHLNFGITINAGDVQFAYRDGYWDRFHRWHPWADPDDWAWYRAHYPGQYWDWVHSRDPDLGWRVAAAGPPISFFAGDLAFAYRDGWWDRAHRWHPWVSEAERIWWLNHHPNLYWDWVHTRDPDMGWRVAVGPGPGPGPAVGVAVGVPWLTFSVGDVAYAYRDGWWDRYRRWHPWASERERVWWRDHHNDRYWDWRHDRDADMGWHG